MPTPSYLSKFQKIRPKFEVPQEVLLEWLSRAHLQSRIYSQTRTTNVSDATPEETAKMRKFVFRFACDPKRISSRGIQTDDAYEKDYSKMQIYKISPETPSGLNMLARTKFFAQQCNQIFEEFYPVGMTAPEHIVHVTCTGYVSPSGPQILVGKRQWSHQTAITHAYHMGCYASLPAIRLAQGYTHDTKLVDIVHTEICSLHLDPNNHAPEQIVVQSLFADGFIKYSVTQIRPPEGFEILKVKEFIIPDSSAMMTWITGNSGMQMSLSKDVPMAVAKHLAVFLEDFQIEKENCVYAIHPGGPRIIDSIQDLLRIPESQIRHSRQVLFEYGNMSSATLPHIWQNILLDPQIKPGTQIISLAFGPGLTIFGGLLKKL